MTYLEEPWKLHEMEFGLWCLSMAVDIKSKCSFDLLVCVWLEWNQSACSGSQYFLGVCKHACMLICACLYMCGLYQHVFVLSTAWCDYDVPRWNLIAQGSDASKVVSFSFHDHVIVGKIWVTCSHVDVCVHDNMWFDVNWCVCGCVSALNNMVWQWSYVLMCVCVCVHVCLACLWYA